MNMHHAATADIARAREDLSSAEEARSAALTSGSLLDRNDAQEAWSTANKRLVIAEDYLARIIASEEDAAEAQAKANKVKAVDRALVPALEAAKQFVLAHNRAYAIMVNAYNAYVEASGGHVEWPTGLGGVDPKRPRNIDQLVAVASELAAIDERNALVERMVADEAAE